MLERVLSIFHRVPNADPLSGSSSPEVAGWASQALDIAASIGSWSDDNVAASLERDLTSEDSSVHVASIRAWGSIAEAARRVASYTPSSRQLETSATMARGETAFTETAEDIGLVVGMAAAAAWSTGITPHLLVESDERADNLFNALSPLWSMLGIPHVGPRSVPLPDARRAVLIATPMHVIERLAAQWWIPAAGWAVPSKHTLILLPDGPIGAPRKLGERVRIGVYETLTPDIVERAGLVADRLKEGRDFRVDHRLRAATLTESGIGAVERRMNLDKPADSRFAQFVHQLGQAMVARSCYQRDNQYVVMDDEVVPLDLVTGKPLRGRRFRAGLHEALERNEGLPVRCPPLMSASMTPEALVSSHDRVGTAVLRGHASTRSETYASSPDHQWGRELSVWSHTGDSGKYLSMSVEIEAAAMERRPVLGLFRSREGADHVGALLAERGIRYEHAENEVEGGSAVIRATREDAPAILWVCPQEPSLYRTACTPPTLGERLEALLVVAETLSHLPAHDDVPRWFATPLGAAASYRRHILQHESQSLVTVDDDARTLALRNLDTAMSLRQARSFRSTTELRGHVATSESSTDTAIAIARPEIARLFDLYVPEGSAERWDRAGLLRVLGQYHPSVSLPDVRQLRRPRSSDRVDAVMAQFKVHWAILATGSDQTSLEPQLRDLIGSIVDAGAHQLHGRLDDLARAFLRLQQEAVALHERDVDEAVFDREATAMEKTAREQLGQEVLIAYGQMIADRRQRAATATRRDQPKVGRNELCPCGSGKKYKRCCGLASASSASAPS